MTDKIVSINGEQSELTMERKGTTFRGGSAEIELLSTRGNEAEIRVGGRTLVVPYVVQGTTVSFSFDGETYVADVSDKGARGRARHRDHSLAAPMPGLVLKILAAAGDVVKKGAPLIILEAMKMEHPIVAPYDGTVTAVNCTEGEMVQPGVDLVDLAESKG